jgi:hypothetical protein
MELKADNIGVHMELARLARTRDTRPHVMAIRGAAADGESLEKRGVTRWTALAVPLISQLVLSLVYSILLVGLAVFVAMGLS